MNHIPRGIVALFFRQHEGKEVFYPVQFMGSKPVAEEAKDHAELNPGTVRIEDAFGRVLWERSVH